jgi:hypothetical protein
LDGKDIIRSQNGSRFCEKIHHIFNGKMKCIVSCLDANCGYISNSVEEFVTVSLSFKDRNGQVFPSQNSKSIEDGFLNFCAPEIIKQEEHFFCNGCNRVMMNGKKHFEFQESPKVLSVCLKRFESSKSGIISKMHDPTSFGMTFDLQTKSGVKKPQVFQSPK